MAESVPSAPAFDLERVIPLLTSKVQEEKLAGLLLLAKHPDGARNKLAHEAIRPFLLQLLVKRDVQFRDLCISVLAASIEFVALEEKFATAITEPLVKMYLEESDRLPEESLESLIALLLCCDLSGNDGAAVFEKTSGILIAESSSSTALLHRLVALTSKTLPLKGKTTVKSALLQVMVRTFCTHQSELKFESLFLLLELFSVPSVRKITVVQPVASNLRMGLLDLLRSRTDEPIFAVLRCVTEVTTILKHLGWACEGPKDGFFALLMALVGVEVSLAFDKEDESSQMLMACVEILELVMRNLRQSDEDNDGSDSMLPFAQLLELREKLNDINRVPLEYLILTETVDDFRSQVATRLVSTWLSLDPDAIKEKEAIALLPRVVQRLPWFLPVLSGHWAADDEICSAFMREQGVEAVASLIESRIVRVAELVVAKKVDEMEQWDSYWVNPFDSIISACSVLVTCCMAHLQQDLTRIPQTLEQLVGAAKLLLGQRFEDCSTLMGFVAAAMAQLIRISPKGSARGDWNRVSIALAMYLPSALESGGLTTIRAVIDSIEQGGDPYSMRSTILDLEINEAFASAQAHWSEEQRIVAKDLLSVL